MFVRFFCEHLVRKNLNRLINVVSVANVAAVFAIALPLQQLNVSHLNEVIGMF